jgi:hypothetical protein
LILSGILGRSPFRGIVKIREGTPYLSLTYLADFISFFHHLFGSGSSGKPEDFRFCVAEDSK